VKNSLKFVILLVGVSLFLWQCKTEDILEPQTGQKTKFKTVSFFEAQQLFNIYQKNTINKLTSKKEGDVLQITPNWSTIKQDSLDFTEALLTNVEAKLNISTEYPIRLVYLNINDTIIKAIESKDIQDVFGDGKLKNGKVFYHLFNGQFLDAYKIEEGIITKRLVKKEAKKINTASKGDPEKCSENYNTSSIFCDNLLGEVTINASSSSSYTIYYLSITVLELIEADPSSGGGDPTATGGGGNSSATNCPGIKIKDSNDNCVCPTGYVEDSSSKCVKLPCADSVKADPLSIIMNILGTINNGISGGLFGNGRGRFHDGVDINAPLGTPIFSMFDGVIDAPIVNSHSEGEIWEDRNNWSQKDKNAAGNRVYIKSTVNGNNVQFGFWHLSKVAINPQTGQVFEAGDKVTQGIIIGYTGSTGSASSIDSNGSHLHIRGRENNQKIDPLNYLKSNINKTTGVGTPCQN
jgi:murein DD-endopeptidase MepM/ murein hydrolase activator NlpD